MLLNEYATPIERAFLLLGLNCSFGKAEIGTLTLSEVVLHQQHPYAAMLDFESTPADSFIKRVRRKNGVWGEFLLWPETVRAIQWAIASRSGQNGNPDGLLFVTEEGHSFVATTKNGNANQRIPNIWDALVPARSQGSSRLPGLELRQAPQDRSELGQAVFGRRGGWGVPVPRAGGQDR